MKYVEAADLRERLLVQDGRDLLKISTVEPHRFTAQVVYPVPPRTQVRSYATEEVVRMKFPSSETVRRYENAYGLGRYS